MKLKIAFIQLLPGTDLEANLEIEFMVSGTKYVPSQELRWVGEIK